MSYTLWIFQFYDVSLTASKNQKKEKIMIRKWEDKTDFGKINILLVFITLAIVACIGICFSILNFTTLELDSRHYYATLFNLFMCANALVMLIAYIFETTRTFKNVSLENEMVIGNLFIGRKFNIPVKNIYRIVSIEQTIFTKIMRFLCRKEGGLALVLKDGRRFYISPNMENIVDLKSKLNDRI